jgi:Thymidylate synthase
MIVNRVRNVCQALPKTVELLYSGHAEKSRAGDVLVAPCPVVTVYEMPTERVLFSAARDANPWFHLVEALWMLAGRDDSATLNRFVRDFGSRYAEPDGRIHDAYGRRWRSGFGFDQLETTVQRLSRDPQDRQCVISMWDAHPEGFNDLLGDVRGRPCNTHLYVRVRGGKVLDLTLCCRSNDMILGGHGANAVHFSVLQEYLAARVGVDVGLLYQLSNNSHVYVTEMERIRERLRKTGRDSSIVGVIASLTDDRYGDGSRKFPLTAPMFNKPRGVDDDVQKFFRQLDTDEYDGQFENRWFNTTLRPMMIAHDLFRRRKLREAREHCEHVAAPDWRMACSEWIERRMPQ